MIAIKDGKGGSCNFAIMVEKRDSVGILVIESGWGIGAAFAAEFGLP